jgi:hypothetical protein
MEITCTRCHQAVEAENCYCPTCGLPQLKYSAENVPGQAPPERWTEPVRDASTVEWKRALPMAVMLAVPAGLLSSGVSPMSGFGMFWMAAAAAWAVALYLRSQRPAWITVGAGARIGLVTGLLGGWMAFAVSGGQLFVQRVVLHQGSQMDSEWKTTVDAGDQMTQQIISGMGPSFVAQEQVNREQNRAMMLSPFGRAGWEAFGLVSGTGFLILFAIAGGALGARLQARVRRPQV